MDRSFLQKLMPKWLFRILITVFVLLVPIVYWYFTDQLSQIISLITDESFSVVVANIFGKLEGSVEIVDKWVARSTLLSALVINWFSSVLYGFVFPGQDKKVLKTVSKIEGIVGETSDTTGEILNVVKAHGQGIARTEIATNETTKALKGLTENVKAGQESDVKIEQEIEDLALKEQAHHEKTTGQNENIIEGVKAVQAGQNEAQETVAKIKTSVNATSRAVIEIADQNQQQVEKTAEVLNAATSIQETVHIISDGQRLSNEKRDELIELTTVGLKNISQTVIDHVKPKFIPTQLTALPSIDLEDVIGREDELNEIKTLLNNKSKVLLLNGMGGIGKTTVAKAYLEAHKDTFSHLAWIDCTEKSPIDAFSGNIELIKNLGLSFTGDDDEAYRYRLILNALRTLPGNNLLIIDNIDGEFKQDFNQNELPGKPAWQVMVTSRHKLAGFEQKLLGVLSLDKAKALFCKNYTDKVIDEDLELLLEYIGRHTLTIELIAKTLATSFVLNDVKNLLAYFKDHQLDAAELQVVTNIAHTDDEAMLYGHLMKTFSLINLAEDEKWVLKQFAVLPPIEIAGMDLLELFGAKAAEDSALNNTIIGLVKKGWLERKNNNRFKIHKIIQEVIRYKLTPTVGDSKTMIEVLIQKFSRGDTPRQEDILNFTPYGEAILANLKEESLQLARLAYKLGLTYSFFNQNSKASKPYILALFIRRSKLGNEHESVALTLNNLANLQSDQREYGKAEENYTEALDIRRKLAKDNSRTYLPDVATTLNNLATLQSDQREYGKAEENYTEALDIYQKLAKDNPRVFDIYFANSLINKASLSRFHRTVLLAEAESLLVKYPDVPWAQSLLSKVNRLQSKKSLLNKLYSILRFKLR